jgi:hypothetical protein
MTLIPGIDTPTLTDDELDVLRRNAITLNSEALRRRDSHSAQYWHRVSGELDDEVRRRNRERECHE